MKNKMLILLISAVTLVSVLIAGIFCYKAFYSNSGENSVKILGYRAAEGINKNGFMITKYENIRCADWIDEDNVLILNNNGHYDNPDAPIEMSTISKYNLNSREVREYSNVIMDSGELQGVSSSRRYVLYGEPRKIPKVESDEWKKASDNKQLFHEKRDILDLETGEIIQDFDKVVNNCSADYKWMNNDMIFVDYGGEWAVLDMHGKSIKRGRFKFDNCADDFTKLIDVSELEVTDEGVKGSFYYTKDFMGNDGGLCDNLYSMDVNTLEEKKVFGSEHSMDFVKHGDVITYNYFNNNGGATEDGVYTNRTFGFKVINKQGALLQECGLPKDRNYSNFELSPDGNKCAFIEEDGFIKDIPISKMSTMNNILKVMDIKTGEVKEITKVEDLMDKSKEEDFIEYKDHIITINGDEKCGKVPGPRLYDIRWSNGGDSLIINYKYTSKEDEEIHNNTYVVTFDK